MDFECDTCINEGISSKKCELTLPDDIAYHRPYYQAALHGCVLEDMDKRFKLLGTYPTANWVKK